MTISCLNEHINHTIYLYFEGMDYGAVGQELLYQRDSRSKQWKLFSCNV